MEFASDAHKACYEKVSVMLKDIFGEMVRVETEAPVFMLPMGSTLAQISVFPWGDDDATVCTRAVLTVGSEISFDLCSFLLHENHNMRFGAFGLDKDDWVFFEHTIVGSTLDKEELKSSVFATVMTADKYDDEIMKRWGGQRMMDYIQSQ